MKDALSDLESQNHSLTQTTLAANVALREEETSVLKEALSKTASALAEAQEAAFEEAVSAKDARSNAAKIFEMERVEIESAMEVMRKEVQEMKKEVEMERALRAAGDLKVEEEMELGDIWAGIEEHLGESGESDLILILFLYC